MSDFVRNVVGRMALPVAAILCVITNAGLLADYYNVGKFGNDFGVYWRTANQPVELAYLWQGRFPFPYAPTMLLWITPLSLVPKWPAFVLFGAVSVAAFVLAFRSYLTKPALGLALISPPFIRGICTGQVSALLAALTIWACGTEKRTAAGSAFGVIASIKPQLVLLAPLMLALNRDWRAFVAAGVTFVSAIVLSLALFGPGRWPEWIASMDHFHRAVSGTNVIDIGITPAVIAERFGFPPLPFLVLGIFAGAATVYLCRSKEPLEQAAAITLGSLMATPYALVYDLAAVVPFLALAVCRGRILAAIAVGAPFHPLPLLVSLYELLRTVRLPKSSTRSAT